MKLRPKIGKYNASKIMKTRLAHYAEFLAITNRLDKNINLALLILKNKHYES